MALSSPLHLDFRPTTRAWSQAIALFAALVGTFARVAEGQIQPHADHALGTVHFPITCSQTAQVEFDRAVALLHHMTYPQAREGFERVATTDPRCAMAHWGI